MLQVQGVTVRFGDTVALDGVDLTVEPGEVVCVLGPSGCGKSTLLGVVTGLMPPDGGTVSWAGRDLAGVPTHRRGFGLMFQDHALFAHADVTANVAFGLKMQGRERDDVGERVDRLLGMVGLVGYGDRRIDELSGGEQQRVALARALAPEPDLLLLDEPLGALDRALRDRLVDDLGSLFDQLDTSVLYVTHDQDEALAVADRVAVMRAGRIEQIGAVTEVWGAPANDFVAAFLGTTEIVDGATIGREPGPVALRRVGRGH